MTQDLQRIFSLHFLGVRIDRVDDDFTRLRKSPSLNKTQGPIDPTETFRIDPKNNMELISQKLSQNRSGRFYTLDLFNHLLDSNWDRAAVEGKNQRGLRRLKDEVPPNSLGSLDCIHELTVGQPHADQQ